MSAEKELREREMVLGALTATAASYDTEQIMGALRALVIPPDVLSWVSAHPEAAKGLAEGTMAAIPLKAIVSLPTMCLEVFRDIIFATVPAASTPVPSDEAQGER